MATVFWLLLMVVAMMEQGVDSLCTASVVLCCVVTCYKYNVLQYITCYFFE